MRFKPGWRGVFDSATRFSSKSAVNFKVKGSRAGKRSTYRLSSGKLQRYSERDCVIRRHRNPFMQGGMRLVYRCQDPQISTAMVAKFSRFEEDDNSWDYISGFVKNAAQTRKFSQMFHNAYWYAWYAAFGYLWEPARLVSCNDAWVYDLPAINGRPRELFIAEPFLNGSEKWFLKMGWTTVERLWYRQAALTSAWQLKPLPTSPLIKVVEDSWCPIFKGCWKKEKDVVGVCTWQTLQILSLDQSFGPADLGPTAMQTFRSLHVCNALCKGLRLSSLSGVPRAPRTRSAVCNVRQRTTLPVTPPPACSKPAQTHRERGRSPTKRTRAEDQPKPHETETLKAPELLLSSDNIVEGGR